MGKRKLTYYKKSKKKRSKRASQSRRINSIKSSIDSEIVVNRKNISLQKSQYNNNELHAANSSSECESEISDIYSDHNNNVEESDLTFEKQGKTDEEERIHGRRIVDIAFLIQQLKNFGTHSSTFACNAANMIFQKEVRTGFQFELIFKCNMCSSTEKLYSDIQVHSSSCTNMGINEAMVFGSLCTGQSFAQMEERCAIMNMPTMSSKTYYDKQKHIHEVIKKNAVQEMAEAAEAEKAEAISRGEIDRDGFPLLTVVVDGTWAKRSYKCNFSSLSGMACIVGFYSKKVIHMGVKNIFCVICAKTENEGTEGKEHVCYKNWSGSANAMEADIVVEGFRQSVELHGVKYIKVIGDGDSSVIGKLRKLRPYGIDQPIEKIECTNHICRNFNNKLKELITKKEYSLASRNLLKKQLERFRIAVYCAIKKRSSQENTTLEEKKLALVRDFLNTPHHIFGDHKKCYNTTTRCEGRENEENNCPVMQDSGLWDEISKLVRDILIKQADSLIYNINNNHAEQYNALVAKFVGGKRCNFIQRDSYTARCEAALASYNNKSRFYSNINKLITEQSPGTFTKRYQNKFKNRRKRKCRRNVFEVKRARTTGPDLEYGRLAAEIDIDQKEFEIKAKIFLKDLDPDGNIELNTVQQKNNILWHTERLKRLTASNFGIVCKMRDKTSRAKMVQNLLYSKFSGSKATRWGEQYEETALKQITEELGIEYRHCGLFVHKDFNYLGGSPDALILNGDGVIEIKCPFGARHLTPQDAIKKKIIKYCTIGENGDVHLKVNHNYHYQIQGQLEITNKTYCIFVIYTPHGIAWERIERDTNFWNLKMMDKLRTFYMEKLLPELVDPRYQRGLPIRN